MSIIFCVSFIIIIGVYIYLRNIYPEVLCYKFEFENLDFVCPNCNYVFQVKWYNCIYGKYTYYTYGKMNLRCPSCKIKDMCSSKRI